MASWHLVWLNLACLLAVGAIGGFDYVTGPEFGISFFYLLPISLAAWAGRRSGLVMAGCAALAWMAADALPRQYGHSLIVCWNVTVRLCVFITVSLLISHVRALTEALRRRVLEKSDALAVEIDRYEVTRDALEQTEQQFRILVEGVRDFAIFMLDRGEHHFVEQGRASLDRLRGGRGAGQAVRLSLAVRRCCPGIGPRGPRTGPARRRLGQRRLACPPRWVPILGSHDSDRVARSRRERARFYEGDPRRDRASGWKTKSWPTRMPNDSGSAATCTTSLGRI